MYNATPIFERIQSDLEIDPDEQMGHEERVQDILERGKSNIYAPITNE